jgi:hypothetical protein
MRAAVVTRFGGPEVFELAELPAPSQGRARWPSMSHMPPSA